MDVTGLRKTFGGKVALADFSLSLGRGKIFGAVGANGGGKTTALRLLAGLLPDCRTGTCAWCGLTCAPFQVARTRRLHDAALLTVS